MCEEFESSFSVRVCEKNCSLSCFFLLKKRHLISLFSLFVVEENEREPYLVISDFFSSREPPHSFTLHFLYHTHTHT